MNRREQPARPPSRLVPALLGFAIIVAGFATLMIRLEVTQEGYRLSALRIEVRKLENQNQRLKLAAAELESHERLRTLAKKYGMQPPPPDHVVMLP
ncbi:MAG: cell division protein FtsL [Candidatus Binataceae bacterium]